MSALVQFALCALALFALCALHMSCITETLFRTRPYSCQQPFVVNRTENSPLNPTITSLPGHRALIVSQAYPRHSGMSYIVANIVKFSSADDGEGDQQITVLKDNHTQEKPVVATLDSLNGSVLIAWYAWNAPSREVKLAVIDASGTLASLQSIKTQWVGNDAPTAISLPSGGAAVTWVSYTQKGRGQLPQLIVIGSDGSILLQMQLQNASSLQLAAVGKSQVMVAWQSEDGIYTQTVSTTRSSLLAGIRAAGPRRVYAGRAYQFALGSLGSRHVLVTNQQSGAIEGTLIMPSGITQAFIIHQQPGATFRSLQVFAMDDGSLGVAWNRLVTSGTSYGGSALEMAVVSIGDMSVSAVFTLEQSSPVWAQTPTVAQLEDGSLLASWRHNDHGRTRHNLALMAMRCTPTTTNWATVQ